MKYAVRLFFAAAMSYAALAQSAPDPDTSVPDPTAPQVAAEPPPDKRVFGVLPNYRTTNSSDKYVPLTTKQKFYIGFKDSTDYPVYLLSAGFAGLYQLTDSHPSFGQGMEGYAKRFGTSIADLTIGNMMTESILPTVLHEDPRYFRRGTGSTMSRIGYAATRIFVTHTDSGGTRFNYSEVVGNSIAAAAGNAYYPQERHLSDNFQRLYVALATDSISQILKEFWPDVKRKWFHPKESLQPGSTPSTQ